MLLTVSSFGESFRRTTKFGGSILILYLTALGHLYTCVLYDPPLGAVPKKTFAGGLLNELWVDITKDYFLPREAVSESMGRTMKNELPFPSTDSTQMRP